MMTGLDHKRSAINVRERFAVTKAKAGKMLAGFKDGGVSGCVILSTCNRTELYVAARNGSGRALSEALCAALGMNFSEYESHLTEREGDGVMEHLCRVASGLDSLVAGDGQIITQVREALEFSRGLNCTDGRIETMFNLSIHAAKAIRTKVLINALGTSAVPEKAVEKIKTMRCGLSGKSALVIGNGRIGRRVAELLMREGMNVTITRRSRKRGGGVCIDDKAYVIDYDERYKALENVEIAVSATASPHLTVHKDEMRNLKRIPAIIVDLAVPRDVEPSVGSIEGVTLLTIDDIPGDGRSLSPESVLTTENIIAEHIAKYNRWREHCYD